MSKSLFTALAGFLLASLHAGVPLCAQVVQTIRADTSMSSPIVVERETLFVIRAGTVALNAERRARDIEKRILQIAADESVFPDSLRMVEREGGVEIVSGETVLLTVFEIDAHMERKPLDVVARERFERISAAIAGYRAARATRSILVGFGLALLAIVLLYLLLKIMSVAFRRARGWLLELHRGIRLGSYDIIRVEWWRGFLLLLLRLTRWVLTVIFVAVALEFILSQFPWTRGFALDVLALVVNPLNTLWWGFVAGLPNLMFLAVLIAITYFVLRGLRVVFRELAAGRLEFPGFYADWAMPTYKLVRVLVIAFSLVVAFPYIPGSSSPAFQGISIFFGVLFSLGSSSAIANIVAGVILIYMRSFSVGDVVKIGETTGRVMKTNLLVTRLRTPKNVEITMPNSLILSTHVMNFSSQAKEHRLILPTTVTIGYDAPWRQVHALLRQAAERTSSVLADPAPFVLQKSLDDFYVTYELNVYVDSADGIVRIYSDLHKNIQDAFNEYGVQIMSPNYEADREVPTHVPKEKWYTPPAPRPGEPGADT